MSEDIKLIPTQALLSEIETRFESCIFAGVQTSVFIKNDVVCRRGWKGPHVVCLGLCSNLQSHINLDQHAAARQLPKGE